MTCSITLPTSYAYIEVVSHGSSFACRNAAARSSSSALRSAQALFGKKYVAAAKDAWNLLKKRGIDALINDCLVNNIWWVSLDYALRSGLRL